MKKTNFTNIEDEILKDCQSGILTQVQISDKYRISRMTISKYLKSKNINWTKKPDPKKIFFSEEETEYIIKEYKNGKSIAKIGKEFDCNGSVIGKKLRFHGIETELEKKHRDVLQIFNSKKDEIIKLYHKDNMSGIKIALMFNVSAITLYKYLKLWGVEVVDRNKRIDVREHVEAILNMYNDNWHFSEMAEHFKCDVKCIKKCLEEQGMDLNQTRKLTGTWIENKIEKLLLDIGIEFEKQFKLESRKFDFYIPKNNILLETHGDYWHGNPKIYETLDTIQRFKKKIDREKRKMAKLYGYKYIWIWEFDIKNNFEKVKLKLLQIISNK